MNNRDIYILSNFVQPAAAAAAAGTYNDQGNQLFIGV